MSCSIANLIFNDLFTCDKAVVVSFSMDTLTTLLSTLTSPRSSHCSFMGDLILTFM